MCKDDASCIPANCENRKKILFIIIFSICPWPGVGMFHPHFLHNLPVTVLEDGLTNFTKSNDDIIICMIRYVDTIYGYLVNCTYYILYVWHCILSLYIDQHMTKKNKTSRIHPGSQKCSRSRCGAQPIKQDKT